MNRFLLLALIFLSGLFPVGFAQERIDTVAPFVGGGLSVFTSGGGISFIIQGGADNLLGPIAARGSLNVGLGGLGIGTSAGFDLLAYVTSIPAPIYLGGGAQISLGSFNTTFGVHATGGVEYFINNNIALFAEVQPTYYFPYGLFATSVNLGANYHFD